MSIKRNDSGTVEAIDTAFLESTVQQAALLLRASGSGFYLCAFPKEKPALIVSHGIVEFSGNEALLRQVCQTRAAGIEAQPALLAVPATWRETLRGVLLVADETAGRIFDAQDAVLLQALAGLTAAALHQAERLTRMTAQFRALHAIDVALTSSLQLDRVLNLILEKACDLVGAEHGSLRLLDPQKGELTLRAHLGDGWTPEVQAYTFPIGHGITGWVAQHRQPYLCPDSHADPQNVLLFDQMNSGVAVPLLTGPGSDQVLGVLLLESTRPAAFDHHDVELLEAMAQQAVLAIQNATQHQALQDEHERRLAAETWTVMGQAATALAHRINTLIGIVPASAAEIRRSLARLEIPSGERAWIESNLDRIERNGRFVLKLADGLFRPFQEPGPSARFDVHRLLNEALQAANLPPDIHVSQEYGPSLPLVESSSLLVDIFLELITNARKALDGQPQPQLELRTWAEADEEGAWVVVQVGDSGVGIAPEQMAHLWSMFQHSVDGLGFGLWWVRTFIERQGGTISCDSELGAGTTFTVRLPACTDAPLPRGERGRG